MIQLRKLLTSLVLSFVLLFATLTPPTVLQIGAIGATGILVTSQIACGDSDLSKLHDILNKTAKSLEAAIDTNGRLYESAVYGAVGSEPAIALRKQVATAVDTSADYVIKALTIAKGLTKETFEQGKLAVLQELSKASIGLTIGHPMIDLVLQSVVGLINQAVAIVQLFQSSIIRSLPRALPQIEKHIDRLERLQEVTD